VQVSGPGGVRLTHLHGDAVTQDLAGRGLRAETRVQINGPLTPGALVQHAGAPWREGKGKDHARTYITPPDRKEAIVLTVALILSLAALILAIASAVKPVPLWIAVVLLAILSLLQSIPLGGR
jgi:hypothetical protein